MNKEMRTHIRWVFWFVFCAWVILVMSCKKEVAGETEKIQPVIITEPVPHDSDDPAIWYNKEQPEESLILGTDKELGGGLYVFDLEGRIDTGRSVLNLGYPNNVDVEYDVRLNDSTFIDIAVTGERPLGRLRAFALPDMTPMDGGGWPVFETEKDSSLRRPMGVAMYRHPDSGKAYVIVSRKSGPTDGSYLWQYEIVPGESTPLQLNLVRKFGAFSGGESEIEAIMVDDTLGYVYYSDEYDAVHKYHADPARGDSSVAVFGQDGFAEDREGIALWPESKGQGKIIVSNQQDHNFYIYERNPDNHQHERVATWYGSTEETDGCEILARPLGEKFPKGIFVAMSEGRVFHVYDLRDLE